MYLHFFITGTSVYGKIKYSLTTCIKVDNILELNILEQTFREACVLLRGVKLPQAHNSNHVL